MVSKFSKIGVLTDELHNGQFSNHEFCPKIPNNQFSSLIWVILKKGGLDPTTLEISIIETLNVIQKMILGILI